MWALQHQLVQDDSCPVANVSAAVSSVGWLQCLRMRTLVHI